MITELIFVGGILFWALFLIISAIIIVNLEYERGFIPAVCLFSFLVLLMLFGNVNPFAWIYEHPLQTILLFVAYWVTGAAWAVVKWYLFVKNRLRAYLDARVKFLIRNGVDCDRATSVPQSLRTDWDAYIAHTSLKRPDVGDHKSIIVIWMAYWPWSMFWTFLRDFIRETYTYVYERIGGLLGRISARIYKNVEQDYQ